MRYISWFSAGCSSFVAAYLLKEKLNRCVYIDIENQHPDSMRFVKDAEKLLEIEIEIIKSSDYTSVDDVIERDRYINGPSGAACTRRLKREVREKWERENQIDQDDVYIWGYDITEKDRAKHLERRMTYVDHAFPLIDKQLSKSEVHGICSRLRLKRPQMYDMGYPNNNCIGCVKGGMGYWNRIRKDFPDVFERRAQQEREIGRSCINGVFLDELDPERGDMNTEVFESCSIMCQLALHK